MQAIMEKKMEAATLHRVVLGLHRVYRGNPGKMEKTIEEGSASGLCFFQPSYLQKQQGAQDSPK